MNVIDTDLLRDRGREGEKEKDTVKQLIIFKDFTKYTEFKHSYLVLNLYIIILMNFW